MSEKSTIAFSSNRKCKNSEVIALDYIRTYNSDISINMFVSESWGYFNKCVDKHAVCVVKNVENEDIFIISHNLRF